MLLYCRDRSETKTWLLIIILTPDSTLIYRFYFTFSFKPSRERYLRLGSKEVNIADVIPFRVSDWLPVRIVIRVAFSLANQTQDILVLRHGYVVGLLASLLAKSQSLMNVTWPSTIAIGLDQWNKTLQLSSDLTYNRKTNRKLFHFKPFVIFCRIYFQAAKQRFSSIIFSCFLTNSCKHV